MGDGWMSCGPVRGSINMPATHHRLQPEAHLDRPPLSAEAAGRAGAAAPACLAVCLLRACAHACCARCTHQVHSCLRQSLKREGGRGRRAPIDPHYRPNIWTPTCMSVVMSSVMDRWPTKPGWMSTGMSPWP